MDITMFWNKLFQHEGEEFRTVTGLPFTYEMKGGSSIKVSRANQVISKINFEKALKCMPLTGPGEISGLVRGSAYVYALITDERMK